MGGNKRTRCSEDLLSRPAEYFLRCRVPHADQLILVDRDKCNGKRVDKRLQRHVARFQRSLSPFAIGYIPCDVEKALLAVKRERLRRHQAGDDRPVFAPELRLQPDHFSVHLQPFDELPTVPVIHPDIQIMRHGGSAHDIFGRIPGGPRKPFIHRKIDAVRHPVDVDGIGTYVKRLRILFLGIPERAIGVMEPECHRYGSKQNLLSGVLQHIPVVRDPPCPCDHLPLGVRGKKYDRDIPDFEDLTRRIGTVHPFPEIDIHQHEIDRGCFLPHSGDCLLRRQRTDDFIPRPLQQERLVQAYDRVILDEEYFLHNSLLTPIYPPQSPERAGIVVACPCSAGNENQESTLNMCI